MTLRGGGIMFDKHLLLWSKFVPRREDYHFIVFDVTIPVIKSPR